jgi:hypothetical protein
LAFVSFRLDGREMMVVIYAAAAAALGVWVARANGYVLTHVEREARRRRRGLCPTCGNDLRYSRNQCPECGRRVACERLSGEI